MRPLTTVVLFLLLVGVACYVYFDGQSPSGTADDPRLLPGYHRDGIEGMVLTNEHGAFHLDRGSDGYFRLTKPLLCSTDSGAMEGLLSLFEQLPFTRRLDSVRPEFGLDPPRMTLTMRLVAGAGEFKLEVGADDPLGGQVWARLEGAKARSGIYVLPDRVLVPLGASLSALREKKLLSLPAWDVDRVLVEGGKAKRVRLSRQGSAWLLEEPVVGRGDVNSVRELLNAALNVSAVEFLDDDDIDLARCGLDPPRLRLTLETTGERARQETLLLGSVTEKGLVHAKRDGDAQVVRISGDVLDVLDVAVRDLRDPRVFPSIGFDLKEARILDDAGVPRLRLLREVTVVDRDREETFRIDLGHGIVDASPTRAGALFLLPSRLRAVDFADGKAPIACGLDIPELTAIFTTQDRPTPLALRVGAKVPGDEGLVHVMNDSETQIYVVRVEDLAPLTLAPFLYRGLRVVDIDPESVRRVQISTAEGMTVHFQEEGPEDDRVWSAAIGDGDDRPVNRTEMSLFLARFRPLEAAELLGTDAAEVPDLGRDGDMRLVLSYAPTTEKGDGDADLATLTLRLSAPGTTPVQGFLVEDPLLFRLQKDLPREIEKLLDRTVRRAQ